MCGTGTRTNGEAAWHHMARFVRRSSSCPYPFRGAFCPEWRLGFILAYCGFEETTDLLALRTGVIVAWRDEQIRCFPESAVVQFQAALQRILGRNGFARAADGAIPALHDKQIRCSVVSSDTTADSRKEPI